MQIFCKINAESLKRSQDARGQPSAETGSHRQPQLLVLGTLPWSGASRAAGSVGGRVQPGRGLDAAAGLRLRRGRVPAG